MDKASFNSDFSALYDLFYATKDYEAEVYTLISLVNKHKTQNVSRIYDIACGTGRHMQYLIDKGYSVFGSDLSEAMLDAAKKRIEAAGYEPCLAVADFSELAPPEVLYDTVICLFDSIGYAVSNEKILSVFKSVYDNLKDNGLFIFEFWHAPQMLKNYSPVRLARFKDGNRIYTRLSETTLNIPMQCAEVKYTIFASSDDSHFKISEELHICRYFQLQEIRLFAEISGFEWLACYDGYSSDRHINEGTWHGLAVCRRRE